MGKRLVILGAGAHARAVADLAETCGFTVAGFTDITAGRPDVLGDDDQVPALHRAGKIDGAVVGVGNSALPRRAALYGRLCDAGIPRPCLVHPRATVAPSARVGDGSVVFAGSVLGNGVEIGEDAVLYSGVLVEHDCRLADHAYLGPGVVLSGAVAIEAGAFLGSGAIVLPGRTIGKDAVVGAGALVVHDVPAGATVRGRA